MKQQMVNSYKNFRFQWITTKRVENLLQLVVVLIEIPGHKYRSTMLEHYCHPRSQRQRKHPMTCHVAIMLPSCSTYLGGY